MPLFTYPIQKCFIAIVFLLSQCLFSQKTTRQKIDSVLVTIQEKTYEEKKDAYVFLNEIILKDQKKSQENFEYALSKDSTDLGRMVMYSRYGQRLSQLGNTEEALQIKLLGLALAQKLKDERMIMDYHGSVGNAYQYLNQIDKALYHLNEGQKIAEMPKNKDYLWFFFYQKGLIQNQLGNTDGITNYYRKMWESVKPFENTSRKRFVLYILIEHFTELDKPEELAFYIETLAQLYEEAHPNTPAGHMPIENIFNKLTSPENIPRLQKAITVSDSLNSMNSLTYNTITLANIYSKIEQPKLAIPYLTRALNKLETVNKPQVKMDLLSKAADLSEEAQDYQQAYNYKIKETTLRDSLNSDRMQRNIAELEVKFDTEKKERKILEQNLIIEKDKRQKNQIILGLVALGVLLVFTYFFFRKRLKDQKTIASQKEAIQQQEIKELQQENKLLALNSMIEGQEAERLRIAKDLHDSLGGLLSTVKAHFTTIQKEIEQLEQLNITEKTNNLIDEACIEVRRISHNMMPQALSISGLEGAVEDIAESLRDEGYKTTLEFNNLPKKMDTTKEVMIYRLIQEVISNMRKHAEAENILIQMLGHKNELSIILEDDGKGFQYEEAIAKVDWA